MEIIKEDIAERAIEDQGVSPKFEFHPSNVRSSYILILMDCNMPFMDGFDCTKFIRKRLGQALGAGIYEQPIISAVTGHAEN